MHHEYQIKSPCIMKSRRPSGLHGSGRHTKTRITPAHYLRPLSKLSHRTYRRWCRTCRRLLSLCRRLQRRSSKSWSILTLQVCVHYSQLFCVLLPYLRVPVGENPVFPSTIVDCLGMTRSCCLLCEPQSKLLVKTPVSLETKRSSLNSEGG